MAASDNPVGDLTPQQIVERGQAIVLEGEYWKQVLADTGELSNSIATVVVAIAESAGAALQLSLSADDRGRQLLDELMRANLAAIDDLLAMQRKLAALIELANGRGRSLDVTIGHLADAAGIDLDDGDGESGERGG